MDILNINNFDKITLAFCVRVVAVLCVYAKNIHNLLRVCAWFQWDWPKLKRSIYEIK